MVKIVDEMDYAQQMSEYNLVINVRAVRQRLSGLSDGICEDCGEPISAARLAVAPWATTCIDCQLARERRGMR